MSVDSKASNEQKSNSSYIFSVVCAYWFVSISMVYLNKFLLSNKDESIPAPLFLTWWQCVVTCFICYLLGLVGEKTRKMPVKDKENFMAYFDSYHVTKLQRETSMSVLPLSLIFVGMITFNNLCLQYVEVSFYNVARSLTIVFSVGFTFFFLGEKTHLRVCATLGIVILGFVLGIDGEVNFSMIGTMCGVMSSVFVSLNSIYTKKISNDVKLSNGDQLFYNNFNASLLFLPLIIMFEIPVIGENFEKLLSPMFWFNITLTGVMGFGIGLVTMLQVNATSPLTHNISGTAKAAVQSIMAFYIWGNTPTTNGLLGIALVLFGSFMYAYTLRNLKQMSDTKKAKDDGVSGAGAQQQQSLLDRDNKATTTQNEKV